MRTTGRLGDRGRVNRRGQHDLDDNPMALYGNVHR